MNFILHKKKVMGFEKNRLEKKWEKIKKRENHL